jgi:hypothetical protein
MPFRYDQFVSPYAMEIARAQMLGPQVQADAVRQAGDLRAQSLMARGAATSRTLGAVGQAANNFTENLGQIRKEQIEAPLKAAQARSFNANAAQTEQETAGAVTSAAEAEFLNRTLTAVVTRLRKVDPATGQVTVDPGHVVSELYSAGAGKAVPVFVKQWTDLQNAMPTQGQPYTLGPDDLRFGPDNKQVASGNPKTPTAPNIGSFEDYVVQRFGDRPTAAQIEQARKDYGQADDRSLSVTVPGGTSTDPADIAKAIIAGDQPPTMQGLYRNAGPVRAELARAGYNLTDAMTDWSAAQRHFLTLNGTQQVRMRQAVDNASHSLDIIEELTKQWQGGKFPILNRAQLTAAKNGALGPQAQTIATQLETEIADVTSELGNVYMGGNSPTDHSLTLAAKNLSANWSQNQLLDAITLARRNLTIRNNSIKNTAAMGVSGTNPYTVPGQGGAAAPTAAPQLQPTGRYNPATGRVEPITAP